MTLNYSVLNPTGIREPLKRQPISPRPDSLVNKTIYVVAQDRPVFTYEISKRLIKALPQTEIVYRKKQGWIQVEDTDLWDEIFEKADALIYGTCMGGGSGLSAVTWLTEAEKRGIPSVYLVGSLYTKDIHMSAVMRGIPALRTLSVDLVGEENVTSKISNEQFSSIISNLVESLTSPLTEEEKRRDDIITDPPSRIAMTGTFEETQDYFLRQGWSDGLPIVPPTEEKVKEMIAGTDHSPDEIVTSLMYPEEMTVTVEKAAIVAVMAGCKPSYMPLLLAIIENWGSNPLFMQSARSDSTFSIMTVINGPIRDELKMNKGTNAMGPGNRANATIGRFLRLGIICLGGSVPGYNDLSAQGSPVKYGFCFPENEEESPWESFHESQGYDSNDSVVSLASGGWCHWSFSADLDHLSKAVANFSDFGGGVVLMSLEAARHYANNLSMSKSDIEKYLLEKSLAQKEYLTPTWYTMDMPFINPRAREKSNESKWQGMDPTMNVIVVGGETSQPIAQAWSCTTPNSVSVDKWR